MKKFMHPIIGAVMLLAAITFNLQPSTSHAQAAPASPLYTALSQTLDLNNTNSLVNANEINLTTEFKWNSATRESGGALNADWWVTDQQGAFLGFEEYSSRASYISLGYQARTVFKGIEVSLGVGVRQSNDAPIGDVQTFLRPTITKQIFKSDSWDIRLAAGCDVLNQGKPNPFFGITFRALKF